MKRVLITGKNSYVGTNVKQWLCKWPEKYNIDTVDVHSGRWRKVDFSQYDVVFHVAGIAHADVGNVSEERKKMYYEVNHRLAVDIARKAKIEGVRQFVFMSSMIVYSGCKEKCITFETIPRPLNFYGDSKWKADQAIRELASENFNVAVIRSPMIYGKNSKGNYPRLSSLVKKIPLFPCYDNRRSMIYIDNLSELIRRIIDNIDGGIYLPQNEKYINISYLVKLIANYKGHRIFLLPGFGIIIRMILHFPGVIGGLANKVFGSFYYDINCSEYKEPYRVVTLEESIHKTECK